MVKNIYLCTHINKTVMCTIEIGAIVGILPDNNKLVHFDLGLCLVEDTTLVLLNHTIWINEILDIWGQRIH